MKQTQIHVTLVEMDTGTMLGEMYSAADELPPAFEPQKTTLHLEGVLWVVVHAEPSTSEEYIQTGEVTVTLEKVKRLPVQDILCTLPTLCDTIPGVQPIQQAHKDALPVVALPLREPEPGLARSIRPKTARPEGNIYRIHEDFWRQIECVSMQYQEDIRAELNDIGVIYRDYSENNGGVIGFRKLHLRKRIPRPIMKPFHFDNLLSLLPQESHPYSGIGYGGTGSMEADGLIEGGYAFQAGPLVIYGLHDRQEVQALCLHDNGEGSIPGHVVAASLREIMVAGELVLVDWCRGVILLPDISAVQGYLEEYFY